MQHLGCLGACSPSDIFTIIRCLEIAVLVVSVALSFNQSYVAKSIMILLHFTGINKTLQNMCCTVLLFLIISVYAFFLMFQEGDESDIAGPEQLNLTFSTAPHLTMRPRFRRPNPTPQNNKKNLLKELKVCVIALGRAEICSVFTTTGGEHLSIFRSPIQSINPVLDQQYSPQSSSVIGYDCLKWYSIIQHNSHFFMVATSFS